MRKPIQIAARIHYLYALCDDGTIWHADAQGNKWERCSEIPQGDEEPEEEQRQPQTPPPDSPIDRV